MFFSVDVITLSDEEEIEGVYYYNRQNDVLRKAWTLQVAWRRPAV